MTCLKNTFTLLLLLCASLAYAEQPSPTAHQSPLSSQTPEEAARSFMYAVYANDAATFSTAIVPTAGSSDLLGGQTLTAEQLEKLRKNIDVIALRQVAPITNNGKTVRGDVSIPEGAKTGYMTQFQGVILAIPMLRTEAGWKVDVRFWLEMRRMMQGLPKITDPEIVAKSFLFGILAKKPEQLISLSSTKIDGIEYTKANDLPSGDLHQVLSLCREMPIVRARKGEVLRLPSGDIVIGDSDPDLLVLVGLMGAIEIPFSMRKVDGLWKIVPQHYFEMLRDYGAV